jgi:signal transduction histidine kinase
MAGTDSLILIVDDDPAERSALRGQLATDPHHGYRFVEAATAAEGLAACRTVRPDAVLLDDSLPDADGTTVLTELSNPDGNLPCAVVMLVHAGARAATADAAQRGAQECVIEGKYDPERLRQTVADALASYVHQPSSSRIERPSEQRDVEAEVRRREDTRAEADRRTDEFLAQLAHELRNPLAAIRSATDLLRIPNGDVRWAADVLDHQVRHLTRLVDDLLDVSRITRGQIVLRKTPADLGAVLARAVEMSRPFVQSCRHSLTVSEPTRPMPVEADATRLEQVFGHLLHNAAKYTPEGGRIDVSINGSGGTAVVTVRDNGVGIPRTLLPHVFNLMARTERSPDRPQGGLGIGLTLVKHLVEEHGGTVEAHSAGAGRGSEFVVRLPMTPTSADRRRASQSDAAPRKTIDNPHAKRVLVIDDNVYAAEGLARLLRLDGHSVDVAYDGTGGLNAALARRPDVIFLDIGLPGLDGYAVARKMRDAGLNGVKLVALTGYGKDDDRRRARAAGFDEYLVKPAEPTELRRLLGVDSPLDSAHLV